jgi:hypothetical protein
MPTASTQGCRRRANHGCEITLRLGRLNHNYLRGVTWRKREFTVGAYFAGGRVFWGLSCDMPAVQPDTQLRLKHTQCRTDAYVLQFFDLMKTLLNELHNHRGVAGLLLLAATLSTGCSGINASKSISPLDFLLPGLHIRNDPPAPAIIDDSDLLASWPGPASSGQHRAG